MNAGLGFRVGRRVPVCHPWLEVSVGVSWLPHARTRAPGRSTRACCFQNSGKAADEMGKESGEPCVCVLGLLYE